MAGYHYSPSGLSPGLANTLPIDFFRRKLTRWLAEVKTFWPHCPAQMSPDGLALTVHSSKKSPAVSSIPMTNSGQRTVMS